MLGVSIDKIITFLKPCSIPLPLVMSEHSTLHEEKRIDNLEFAETLQECLRLKHVHSNAQKTLMMEDEQNA